jgi:enoyl-CoA hydratase/carnithine racemase
MGPGRALEFILEAENCSPARAFELGLVERLYIPEDLVSESEAFARRIAASAGRIGINAAKRSIMEAVSLPIYEGLEVDRVVHWDSMRRGGFLAGVEAFMKQYG